MQVKQYQHEVLRTVPTSMSVKDKLTNFSMGLAGEAGELIDILKKHIFQGHCLEDKSKIKEELSDCFWYLANLANVLEIDLEEVMDLNIEKLKKRYPNGFEERRSVNRETL
jgi:NTP pyrophosphatase (non-canonical NTP hydrolase)